ncbi:MAG TPA: MarR family transcriptional regulator [Phenylobacterium sp.]|nr:MarR family transcriptional regulator [Phenylobacterium sp.]
MIAQTPFETTLAVRDTCLCLHTQRAARVLARRFDEALRPFGLTNTQFSLLNALNGPEPASVSQVASLLGADRTTLTAALKPLVRRGLAENRPDPADGRMRRLSLTAAGHAVLAEALPAWTRAHARLEAELADVDAGQLRGDLNVLAARPRGPAATAPCSNPE